MEKVNQQILELKQMMETPNKNDSEKFDQNEEK